ncbi:hypothetical protein RSAG8_10069, partial [Rhizoctonia solani AG-8 WAC10335]
MSLSTSVPRFQRSRNGCLTCKAKRKKCDEKRPICSRCSKADSDCVWPSSHQTLDPQIEFSSDSQETFNTVSSGRPRAHVGIDPEPPSFEPTYNSLEDSPLVDWRGLCR